MMPDSMKTDKPHFHRDESGVLVKCYHKCKNVLTDYAFWLGVTLSFPLEHYIWTKLWPFYEIAEWLGLIIH